MSPLRFTFGVEFEFSLASLADDIEDPLPSDTRQVREIRPRYERRDILRTRNYEDIDRKVKKTVAEKLRAARLPALTTIDPEEEKDIDNSYPWAHGHWVITTDSTIAAPEEDKLHDWWQIEVNSPPYFYCEQALDAVLLVCRVLTSSFRTNVNESCGLHVHVGNGNDGFDLHTIRNLMAFLWCFEPVIDKLHPSFRLNNMWCKSIRTSSNLAQRVKSFNDTNVDILKRIFEETHIDELFAQMSENDSYGKDAYNTRNLREARFFKHKVTLEFRQHEGTLDGPRTIAWVQTVVGILEFAADCDRFCMAAFLMEHAEIEDRGGKLYEIEELLRDIGLEESATFYASRPQLS
jgi:hypothetical protein